jgi:hypothetical protein
VLCPSFNLGISSKEVPTLCASVEELCAIAEEVCRPVSSVLALCVYPSAVRDSSSL